MVNSKIASQSLLKSSVRNWGLLGIWTRIWPNGIWKTIPFFDRYKSKKKKRTYKMRWTLARGLLRGNLVSHKEQQVAAISTNAISEQAHQTPSRPLSSAPLPQKTTDITDNRINIKTPVPGIFSFFVKSISRNFREVDFTKKSISKLQYQVYSLLDNVPN